MKRNLKKKTLNKAVNLAKGTKEKAITYLGLNLKMKSLISSLKTAIAISIIAIKTFMSSILDSLLVGPAPVPKFSQKKTRFKRIGLPTNKALFCFLMPKTIQVTNLDTSIITKNSNQ